MILNFRRLEPSDILRRVNTGIKNLWDDTINDIEVLVVRQLKSGDLEIVIYNTNDANALVIYSVV